MHKYIPLIATLLLPINHLYAEAVTTYPEMKEGEWLMTMKNDMNIPGMPAGFMQDTKAVYCIDKATQKKMFDQAQEGNADCEKADLQKNGDTYTAKVSCSRNGRKMNVESVTKLISDNKFTSVATMTATGAPPMKVSSTAVYQGECKDGRKPGDMKLLNTPGLPKEMGNMNVEDLKKMAEQMKSGMQGMQ